MRIFPCIPLLTSKTLNCAFSMYIHAMWCVLVHALGIRAWCMRWVHVLGEFVGCGSVCATLLRTNIFLGKADSPHRGS